jgi:esterase
MNTREQTLHCEECGSGPPLVILHGLLGSGGNWRIIAKKLADICRVVMIDLPNHGRSPHAESADIGMICGSVAATMRTAGAGRALLLGHSLGGKIAMRLSSEHPEAVQGLIVADMLPKAIPPAHLFILRACEQLDLGAAASRADLDQQLARAVVQPEVRAFILKNVRRDANSRFRWQINLPNIIANYRAVSDDPALTRPYEGPALFIGGERSPYRIASEMTLIRRWFPQAAIKVIPAAGHLVHTDQPEAFIAAVRDFISAQTLCTGIGGFIRAAR